MSNTTKDILTSIKNASKAKTTPYDTQATVKRIEGNTAWVHIPGGVDETPVQLTIAANVGDSVQVRVSGGKAFLVGNGSAPPTDDRVANYARSIATTAQTTAEGAQVAADSAEASAAIAKQTTDEINAYAETAGKTVTQILNDGETAGTAAQEAKDAAQAAQNSLKSVVQGATTVEKAVSVMQTALEAVVDYDPQNDTTTEYFWHDANGAHVLGTSGDYRNDITSTGMEIVDTSTEEAVAEFSGSGINFYDSEGGNRHKTFSIDSTGVVIYKEVSEESAEITTAASPVTYVLSHKPTTAQGHNSFGFVCPSDGSVPLYFQNTGAPITFQWEYRGISGGTIEYDGDATCVITPPSSLGTDAVTALFYYEYEIVAPSYDVGTRDSTAGKYSAVIGEGLQAIGDNSVAVGKYNDDPYGGMLFSVGNGTADNARSNAMFVDYSGSVNAAGDITDGGGNVLANKADTSAIPTATSDLTNDSGFIDSSWHCYGNYHGLSSSLTLATSDKKVALGTFSGSGCSSSSNGIKIDANHAGTYSISGAIYASTGYTANDIVHAVIYKNSTLIGDTGKRVSNGSPYEIISVGPLVVDLAAGDVVYLYARNQSGARGTVASYGNTQLNVGLNLYRIG